MVHHTDSGPGDTPQLGDLLGNSQALDIVSPKAVTHIIGQKDHGKCHCPVISQTLCQHHSQRQQRNGGIDAKGSEKCQQKHHQYHHDLLMPPKG